MMARAIIKLAGLALLLLLSAQQVATAQFLDGFGHFNGEDLACDVAQCLRLA